MKNLNLINSDSNIRYFGMARKVVANMTSESWQYVPHVTYMYEPDITKMLLSLKRINSERVGRGKITLNTLLLKIIAEGLKQAPMMNSHIEYSRFFVTGKIKILDAIDISMPMILDDGNMITVKVPNVGAKNLSQISQTIADIRDRSLNTITDEALYETSLKDTMECLKKGMVPKVIGRLVGSILGKYRIKRPGIKHRIKYSRIPRSEKLTSEDLSQGSITVSNVGSIYKNGCGHISLLEIVPPQTVAIGISGVQTRPVAKELNDGSYKTEIRKILPISLAFDHRALDMGDIVPFMKKLDEIFAKPEIIEDYLGNDEALLTPDESMLLA